MSGAPALYFNRQGTLSSGPTMHLAGAPVVIFHGIYASRVGKTDEFEAQLGTVWRKELIDEIIDAKIIPRKSSELPMNTREIALAIEKCWPQENDSYAEQVLRGGFLVDTFAYLVLEEICGRADPDDVKAEILAYAKTKRGQ